MYMSTIIALALFSQLQPRTSAAVKFLWEFFPLVSLVLLIKGILSNAFQKGCCEWKTHGGVRGVLHLLAAS